MGTGTILLGMAVFTLLAFVLVGGPAVLMDWLRKRSNEAIRCQIALTDAIDSQLGPIVSPVVKNPLWGPWKVQIAVPFSRPGAVGTILQLVDELLTTSDYMGVGRYRIVLTAQQNGMRQESKSLTSRPTERRLGHAGLAA